MADTDSDVDLHAIERDFRAGVLSLREISASHKTTSGQKISHVRIKRLAERYGWEQDLKARIQAKAEVKLQRETALAAVPGITKADERQVIEANAQRIAEVRGSHRADIARARLLSLDLMTELEAMSGSHLIPSLMQALKDGNQKDLVESVNKIVALPSRVSTLKQLVDTLRTLVSLEREAYGVVDGAPPENPDSEDNQPIDRRELAREVAFMLQRAVMAPAGQV